MLPIRCKPYTPPSSPDSLPSLWNNSFSPPSSPQIEPLSLDNEKDLPTRLIDPLAASYSSNHVKRTAPASAQCPSPNKRQRLEHENVSKDALVWEAALEQVFHTGIRCINLSSYQLTSIPSHLISDLNKLVVLPGIGETMDDSRIMLPAIKPADGKRRAFTRVQTAPASSGMQWGSTAMRKKSASSGHVLSGSSTEHIDLYLGNNGITGLPTELWSLRDLRILSLRNNRITYLPPEVATLINLVDLNVALNQLSFLPSELTKMTTLKKLIVLPNPFLPEVPFHVSETRLLGPRVPPLTELALRVMLAPPILPSGKKTLLEDEGQLPIATGPNYKPISSPLRRILATCVPGSIVTGDTILPKESHEDCDHVTGIGQCPNPLHGRKDGVFVRHVEERFSWVDSIVDIKLGGLAPLRWRGCQAGCLDFLDPAVEVEEAPDVDVDVDPLASDDSIIHTVSFAAIDLDFDDDS